MANTPDKPSKPERNVQPIATDPNDDAEVRLLRALDAIGDGAWDWDLKSGAIYFSDRWRTSLGYSRGDVQKMASGWIEYVHADDMDFHNEAVEAHLKGLTVQIDCEFRMRTKEGGYRWTHERARVVDRDENGEPIRMVGINTDITLAKSVQLALDEAEGRCRSIVETAGCIIVVLDTDYRVREWNPAAERISGWSEDEVRGRDYINWFLPERFREPVRTEIDRLIAGGENTFGFENPIVTRDGDERDVLWNASKLLNSEGKAWAVVAIGQDVTMRNEALRQRDVALHEREVALDKGQARD